MEPAGCECDIGRSICQMESGSKIIANAKTGERCVMLLRLYTYRQTEETFQRLLISRNYMVGESIKKKHSTNCC
jgi:precorrin-6B methylase 2